MNVRIHVSHKHESFIGSILLFVTPSWKVRGLLQTAEAKASWWHEHIPKEIQSTVKMHQLFGLNMAQTGIFFSLPFQGNESMQCCVIYKIN